MKSSVLMFTVLISFMAGIMATVAVMYLYPNSPLMVRDKAFNDTANDLRDCLIHGKTSSNG